MNIRLLSIASLFLAASCTQNTFGSGTTNNGQLLTADLELSDNKLYAKRYVVKFSDQTECVVATTPKQHRAKQSGFPMTCTNGNKGTASFRFFGKEGGVILSFALNDGISGIVTFNGGWTS